MIRGVIFDLGNTLMYFSGEWEPIAAQGAFDLVRYLNGRGYPVPEAVGQEFLAARDAAMERRDKTNIEYPAEQALTDTLAGRGICYIPDGVISLAIGRFFEAEEELWLTYEDTRATLESLKAMGLKLAIFSNASDHSFVQRIAQRAGIAEYFDPILSSAGLELRKPDPRVFQPILNAWRILPPEIVMVGDAASYDVLGAHRAGMRAILIEGRWAEPPKPHAEFKDEHLMEPDARIHQLAELPQLLQMWMQKVE